MSSASLLETLPLTEVAPAEAAGVSRGSAERTPAAATAERAVEAVMEVAERASTRERSSVTLQFDLHGTPLDVRVVMRAGEVQTTFHTNSPELRAALQTEWAAVTEALPAERIQSFAAPVFAASDANTATAGGGDTGARQRQFEPPADRPGVATPTRNAPETPSENPTVRQPAYATTAHHLHTLA